MKAIQSILIVVTAALLTPEAKAFDLKAALAAAKPGETVHVPAGRYSGPLLIDKPVRLVADPGAVIDGHEVGTVVQIVAPGTSFTGFTVRGTGEELDREHAAIWVRADHVLVENNHIEDALFGICVHQAKNVTLRGNVIGGKNLDVPRRGDGIRLWYSPDGVLENNVVKDVRDVVIWFSRGVHIRNNYVGHSRYGLHFMFCDDVVLENNRLEENSVGTYLMNSRNLTLVGNTLAANRGTSGYGIGLKDMDGVNARDNRIVGNRVGVYIDSSPTALDVYNRFTRNLIAYNETGVAMLPSVRNNLFTQNSFQENQEQVAILGSGLLHGNSFTVDGVGNYWSDYRGFDSNNDGIGDLPYRAQGLFENLMDREPKLRLFLYSPTQQVLELAAQAVPTVKPKPKFTDSAPLMQPRHLPSPAAAGATDFKMLVVAITLMATSVLVLLASVRSAHGRARLLPSRIFRGRFPGKGEGEAPAEAKLVRQPRLGGSLALPLFRRPFKQSGSAGAPPSPLAAKTPGVPMNDSPTGRIAPVLDVRNLTKRFGKYTAVDTLSFSIAPGEALALWGSNGAGKTTAIRCILGITGSKGAVSIDGIDVARDAKRARCHIGYVPQENSFQGDLGVGEAMRFYARLKGQTAQRAADLLEQVGLTEHSKKKVSALSGGMRKRLALAAALLNDPPLLVLDEIAANLDAEGRNSFLALLCELKHQGKAILFTSHRLDEVTALADRVLVLNKGKATGIHAPAELSAAIGIESRVKVLLPEASIRSALEALHAEGFAAQRNGRGIWVDVVPGNKAAPIHALARRQIVIDDFEIENHDAEYNHDSRH